MKKHLLFILFSVFFANTVSSQNNLWTPTSPDRTASIEKSERAAVPTEFLLYNLNFEAFKALVETAPMDNSRQISNVQVTFPNPTGELENYIVYQAPVMEEGLANRYPSIKSYVAKGINDKTASIRFSVTLFGLHAMLTSGDAGTFYIDTYTKDLHNYIVYSKKSLFSDREFMCLNQDETDITAGRLLETQGNLVNDGLFRQYRLAMACTIEYAAFHVNAAGVGAGTLDQKKAAVLAAMVVTMTRVNGVYETDMSLRMNLVANNDLVIFIDSDSFDNNNAGTLINQSQSVIDTNIGNGNYDIGHTVSTGGGGLAGLGVICNNTSKARGITGAPSPVGDPFDIDYVAHEIGHQFGGSHTFNNSCGGNRSAANAAEPGSGSTIMAYAGICAPNVQNNSDAHFHAVSIAQMTTRVLTTNCAAATNSGNIAPVVNAGPDYTIPFGTAFVLEGAATDANNDALTYCWEQTDVEISVQSPQQSSTSGPNFRSNVPISSPNRYMPRIQDVINNNLAPTWEVVPNVARTMNFALTVRDNRTPNGGQTNRDNTVITTSSVGPFLVNAPNTNVSWVVGSNQNVTWNVAGTTANGINAAYVDIFLSTDGGFTYPILLASKVPNDGSETITVPNNVGLNNRIMVKGYKHIFFDISNTNFSIQAPTSSFGVSFNGVAEQQNKQGCSGATFTYAIPYTTYAGFTGTTSFAASGLPAGATVTFSPNTISANGNVTMTVSNTTNIAAGFYSIIVTATSGATSRAVPFYLELFNANFDALTLSSPANLAIGQPLSLSLSWQVDFNATLYDVQVAANPNFTPVLFSGTVSATNFALNNLASATQYYWRVLPKNNACSGSFSAVSVFKTGQIECTNFASTDVPVTIPTTANVTANSTVNITSTDIIADVNITVDISHSWVNDMIITLISPSGTQVQLVNRPCTNASLQNITATFDDAGIAVACATNPAISGTVQPVQSLAAFNGQSMNGLWTLRVFDPANFDGGAINGWTLNLCKNTAVPLAVNESALQNFSLYPNPNNGSFTVSFNSNSSNKINVSVFDIRGRNMYSNDYQNNGFFNENIQLNAFQSGIYLVKVQDGDQQITKKIIIE